MHTHNHTHNRMSASLQRTSPHNSTISILCDPKFSYQRYRPYCAIKDLCKGLPYIKQILSNWWYQCAYPLFPWFLQGTPLYKQILSKLNLIISMCLSPFFMICAHQFQTCNQTLSLFFIFLSNKTQIKILA